jgi:hypothetical protein
MIEGLQARAGSPFFVRAARRVLHPATQAHPPGHPSAHARSSQACSASLTVLARILAR